MANQGNRDREGNLGQPNREGNNPTGTSGRSTNREGTGENAERNHQEGGDRNRRQNADEDDESLGSRNTNR